jgi:DNA (cytosine-5)-methyltransferase 1
MRDKQTRIGEKYLGKLNLDSDVQQRIGKGKIKTHVSLFSGCGGLDVGFANAGIQTRVMIEWDKSCCETLRHNFLWEFLKERKDHKGKLCWKNKEEMKKQISWYHEPEPVIMQRDICTLTSKEIMEAAKLQVGECSIISGGFPCQGFSLAGRRMMDDPRNKLYKQFVRIVDDLKPASIMGENVQGIVSMAKGEVIQQICEDFANCGYDVTWDLLNAADYGVPQHRIRLILIGFRVDAMRFNPEEGRPSFHIAACPGTIEHPYLFYERLKRWKNKELLERIEKSPQCSFKEKKK